MRSKASGATIAGDAPHRRRVQRGMIRIGVHEAHEAAIHRHLCDVAGEQRALAVSTARPVQHSGAGEMAAAANQQHIVGDTMMIAAPVHDRGDAVASPIGGHRRADRPGCCRTPRSSRRARHRKCGCGIAIAFSPPSERTCAIASDVAQRNAVPHPARPSPSEYQQCALADGEAQFEGDAAEVRDRRARRARWRSCQRRADQKGLAVPVHVLPLVLADRT